MHWSCNSLHPLHCVHNACAVLQSIRFFLPAILSMWCDFKSNHKNCSLLRCRLLSHKREHRQRLSFSIRFSSSLDRFILTLHEHNFPSCFLALRCNGTRVFETVKTYVNGAESINASTRHPHTHRPKWKKNQKNHQKSAVSEWEKKLTRK